MTDHELGAAIIANWNLQPTTLEDVGRRARKLLAHEASDPLQSVASDMNEMRGDLREIANRIETHDKALDRIEKKLDWLKWRATPARLVPSGEWIENPLLAPTRQETLRVEQATEPEWPK